MRIKILIYIIVTLLLGVWVYTSVDNLGGILTEQITTKTPLVSKPVLDSAIDAQILSEQETLLSKGEMKGGKSIGTDGVERTVIPYDGPNGKGYIIEYKKTVETTDKNGSTTVQTFYQQIDYGSEGRTTLW